MPGYYNSSELLFANMAVENGAQATDEIAKSINQSISQSVFERFAVK